MFNYFKKTVIAFSVIFLLFFLVSCTNKYTVTFIDYDNSILEIVTVRAGDDLVAPSDPLREGYTFSRWDMDLDTIKTNLEVKAIYDPLVHKVIFINEDGTLIKEEQVTHASDATAPEVPLRAEMTFISWDIDYTNVKTDLVVTAIYNTKEFEVTFKDYNGIVLETKLVKYGANAIAPAAPSRYMHDFLGWDVSFNNVKADLIVTATYSDEKMPILFYANNEVFTVINVLPGTKLTKPELEPTKDDLTFAGWLVEGTNDFYDFNEVLTTKIRLEAKFIDASVDYEYRFGSGGIILDKYIGTDTEIIIPKFIKGTVVKVINNSAFEGTSIESVFIHKDITEVKFFAFRDVTTLKTVVFEEGSAITEIADRLFMGATSLESVNIPNTVVIIKDFAFENTPMLTDVTFEENGTLKEIRKNAFYGSGLISIKLPETLEKIETWAFAFNLALEEVDLGNNNVLQSIGTVAFEGNRNLLSFTLPNSVKTIGIGAFQDNKELTTFTISQGSMLEEIGATAFFRSSKLSSIFIPKGVLVIDTQTFDGTGALRSVEIEEGSLLTTIGNAAFNRSGILSIIIPKYVVSIGGSAFAESSLSSIAFLEDSRLETIGKRAFADTYLVEFLLPKSVTTIGDDLFLESWRLEHFYVEQGSVLTIMPGGMFGNVDTLKTIVIPNSVIDISARMVLGVRVKPKIFIEATETRAGYISGWSNGNEVFWGGSWHYVEGYKPYIS